MTVYRNPGEVPRPNPISSAVAAQVAAREHARNAQHRIALAREQADRDAAIGRHAKRPLRVSVQRNRITIARQSLVDSLVDQAMWGILFNGFMFGMIGYPALAVAFWFAGLGLASSMVVAGVAWCALVLGANIIYARHTNRPWILDVTDDDCFALHNGDVRKATLVGRVPELAISLPQPNPTEVHGIRFEHAGNEVGFYYLTDRDIALLCTALSSRFRVS